MNNFCAVCPIKLSKTNMCLFSRLSFPNHQSSFKSHTSRVCARDWTHTHRPSSMKLEPVGEISWSSVAWCWWCYPCGRIWNWQITVKLGISCIIYIHPSVMIVDIRLFPMQKKKKTYFPFGLTIREKYKQKKVPFPPAIKKLFIVFLVVSLSFQENILYLRPNRNREQWERTVDVFFLPLYLWSEGEKLFFFSLQMKYDIFRAFNIADILYWL